MQLSQTIDDAIFTIKVPKRSIERAAINLQKHYSVETGKLGWS